MLVILIGELGAMQKVKQNKAKTPEIFFQRAKRQLKELFAKFEIAFHPVPIRCLMQQVN